MVMSGEERRTRILQILKTSNRPVSGGTFAKQLHVSRQVIVQDIALIRANGVSIYSTNRGYLLETDSTATRVFKTIHKDTETEEELKMIVDIGGAVEDVFVYHKVYGVVRGELNLKTRREIDIYMDKIKNGQSSLLKNITAGYHYHTVTADSEETLDLIQEKLRERGFLAPLQDYEPVDFWSQGQDE